MNRFAVLLFFSMCRLQVKRHPSYILRHQSHKRTLLVGTLLFPLYIVFLAATIKGVIDSFPPSLRLCCSRHPFVADPVIRHQPFRHFLIYDGSDCTSIGGCWQYCHHFFSHPREIQVTIYDSVKSIAFPPLRALWIETPFLTVPPAQQRNHSDVS